MVVIVGVAVVLQYLGFETKGAVREYAFALRGSGGESSEYFVVIPNAAFVEHRARYQDAPNICSLRLHREFASETEHPPSTRFCITDAELADYKNAYTPQSKPTAAAHREGEH
jgi:hypothetical protein